MCEYRLQKHQQRVTGWLARLSSQPASQRASQPVWNTVLPEAAGLTNSAASESDPVTVTPTVVTESTGPTEMTVKEINTGDSQSGAFKNQY